MNLPDGLLGGGWTLAAWLLFIPVLAGAIRRAPWRRLADSAQLNVWLGTAVALALLWNLQAGIRPGLALHLVGATVFTLAFGPALAFAGLCVALAGATLNGAAGWQSFAANALLMAGCGVAVTQAVLRASERFLPRQVFVFIFVNGFFAAALSVAAIGFVTAALFWLAGVYPAAIAFGEYLPYALLLAFSEAWLSGMVVTLHVVYRPQWIVSFDDARYLRD